ncbi:4'-phosphopantetheinyl transferase family protein [Anaeromyxobacter oryzisoli]|uniref:4'-phosphopantetheinyl transferase family protein n=1 Tax=Anaeromyxobacter oryzisoli TaxID=2925408 RepID=UPI001F5A4291|nr:4'-phosphopantetheinyl transferase superfamily protein [Anaeromyxobacter sp. SG63]
MTGRANTERMHLGSGDAHLWLVEPDRVGGPPGTLTALRSVLSADERAAQARFQLPSGRVTYLVAHALVRCALSRFCVPLPQQWTFKVNAFGKPALAAGSECSPLSFNLSHTDGLIACLVGHDMSLGVDTECLARRAPELALLRSCFAPGELADLLATEPHRRHERLIRYWTLKEAYVKALGTGLSLPLDRFSFRIDGAEIRISFDPGIRDDPDAWQFMQLRPTARHLVAVAFRRERRPALRLHVHRGFPFEALFHEGTGGRS